MRRNKLKIVHHANGKGYMYIAQPLTIGGDDGLSTVDPNGGGGKPIDNGGIVFTNPTYEVDFYSIDCPTLSQMISNVQTLVTTAKLTQQAAAYYADKLNQMQSAYAAKCGSSPDNPVKKPDITVLPNPSTPGTTPGTIVNVGDTSGMTNTGMGGFGAGDGGGGGGGGSNGTPKKSNWWLWALCIGAFALSLYKGRNTTLKMPG